MNMLLRILLTILFLVTFLLVCLLMIVWLGNWSILGVFAMIIVFSRIGEELEKMNVR